MPFDPILAEIRFGVGLSPAVAGPVDVTDMLDRLTGQDFAAQTVVISPFSTVYPSPKDYADASRALNQGRGTDQQEALEQAQRAVRAAGRDQFAANLAAEVARSAMTPDGFRERLSRFWADHFTVRAINGISRHLVSPYIEEAIRPNLNGRFAHMLTAAVTHPMMLVYLDQHLSMGPNSPAAQRNNRGLNENLARELLELHSLGVGGNYSQTDVRQLAELLTGLTYSARNGFSFREVQAEPGAETVLGVSYGGAEPSLDDILAALEDISMHPDTAHHLARKLLVHFVGPDYDDALVQAMAQRYLESGGRLISLYEAMLNSDAAWNPERVKVKQPIDFISSSSRALAVPTDRFLAATLQEVRQGLLRPLQVMGQDWQKPVGPDGWPEEEAAWVTPQGMAGRITWAMTMPVQLLETLPDPRDFVHHALGPEPPEAVVFAASAAEKIADGVGVVLASAAFQRR